MKNNEFIMNNIDSEKNLSSQIPENEKGKTYFSIKDPTEGSLNTETKGSLNTENDTENNTKKILIKKCHFCGSIIESYTEIQQCPSCKKHFLPLTYFTKLQKLNDKSDYLKLFVASEELSEEDLIKGLHVLW